MEKKYCIRGNHEDFGVFFTKLCEASYSVLDCIGTGLYDFHPSLAEIEKKENRLAQEVFSESRITKALAENVLLNRPTGNGVGWGECKIDISPTGVDYITSGGLQFGWVVIPECVNWPEYAEYTLVVYCFANEGGTLEKSLIEHGFVPAKSA